MGSVTSMAVGVFGLLMYDSDSQKTANLGALLVSGAIFSLIAAEGNPK